MKRFGSLVLVLLSLLFAFSLIGCSSKETVELKPTDAAFPTPSPAAVAAPTPMPRPEPTATPNFSGVDQEHLALINALMRNWKPYSYSSSPPKEKDNYYYAYETNKLEVSASTLSYVYESGIGYPFSNGSIKEDFPFTAKLYTFPDNSVVMQGSSSASQSSVVFESIVPGDYYYSLSSEGYQTYYSEVFGFRGKGEDVLIWGCSLLPTENLQFSDPFTIQLLDESSKPIARKIINITELSDAVYSSRSYGVFMTDDSGFVCQQGWESETATDYTLFLCLFCVPLGNRLEICDEELNEIAMLQPVGNQNNPVIIVS